MNDCSTCGAPMVWSLDHCEMRCAVYGAHDSPQPSPLILEACRYSDSRGGRYRTRLRAVS